MMKCVLRVTGLMIGFLLAGQISAATAANTGATTLWYDAPGTGFSQGLPLGNGRLGMMVLGGTHDERIVLNEESMWNGSAFDDNRPDAHKSLPKIRLTVLEKRWSWNTPLMAS